MHTVQQSLPCRNCFSIWSTSYDPYDMSRDDEDYRMPENVAQMMPGQNDCAARLLTAARHYVEWPRDSTQNWGRWIRMWMITTPPVQIFAAHFGFRTSPTGRINERKHTHSTPISLLWHWIYSLSYHTVSEWRPVFALGEMLSAWGSPKPLARPILRKSC